MEIKRIVEKLMRKYGTNDPFKLAAQLNVVCSTSGWEIPGVIMYVTGD